jgi:hypothetical protein
MEADDREGERIDLLAALEGRSARRFDGAGASNAYVVVAVVGGISSRSLVFCALNSSNHPPTFSFTACVFFAASVCARVCATQRSHKAKQCFWTTRAPENEGGEAKGEECVVEARAEDEAEAEECIVSAKSTRECTDARSTAAWPVAACAIAPRLPLASRSRDLYACACASPSCGGDGSTEDVEIVAERRAAGAEFGEPRGPKAIDERSRSKQMVENQPPSTRDRSTATMTLDSPQNWSLFWSSRGIGELEIVCPWLHEFVAPTGSPRAPAAGTILRFSMDCRLAR